MCRLCCSRIAAKAGEDIAARFNASEVSTALLVRAWVRWKLLRTGLTLGSLTALSIALLQQCRDALVGARRPSRSPSIDSGE